MARKHPDMPKLKNSNIKFFLGHPVLTNVDIGIHLNIVRVINIAGQSSSCFMCGYTEICESSCLYGTFTFDQGCTPHPELPCPSPGKTAATAPKIVNLPEQNCLQSSV